MAKKKVKGLSIIIIISLAILIGAGFFFFKGGDNVIVYSDGELQEQTFLEQAILTFGESESCWNNENQAGDGTPFVEICYSEIPNSFTDGDTIQITYIGQTLLNMGVDDARGIPCSGQFGECYEDIVVEKQYDSFGNPIEQDGTYTHILSDKDQYGTAFQVKSGEVSIEVIFGVQRLSDGTLRTAWTYVPPSPTSPPEEETEEVEEETQAEDEEETIEDETTQQEPEETEPKFDYTLFYILGGIILVIIVTLILILRGKKKK